LKRVNWLYIFRTIFFSGLCIIAFFLWFLYKDRGAKSETDKDLEVIYRLTSDIPLEAFLDGEESSTHDADDYEILYKRIIAQPKWSITNWKKLKTSNAKVKQKFFKSLLYGIVTTNPSILREKMNFLQKNNSYIASHWNNMLNAITLLLINGDWEDYYKEVSITNCAYTLSLTKGIAVVNFWSSLKLRGLSDMIDINFYWDCKRINNFVNKPFITDGIVLENENPLKEAFFRAGMPGLFDNSTFLFEGSTYFFSQHQIIPVNSDTTQFPSFTINDIVLNNEGTSGYALVSVEYNETCGIIWRVRFEKQDFWGKDVYHILLGRVLADTLKVPNDVHCSSL